MFDPWKDRELPRALKAARDVSNNFLRPTYVGFITYLITKHLLLGGMLAEVAPQVHTIITDALTSSPELAHLINNAPPLR